MNSFTELEVYFANLLLRVKRADLDYNRRYGLVLQAVTCAHSLGFTSGFRVDPDAPEWPVAYIELPTGQVTWHMMQHPEEWDGHDTDEKYRRCDEYTTIVATIAAEAAAEESV